MSDERDAVFTIQMDGTPVCDICRRPMADHKSIEGQGKFEGWTRYRCMEADNDR